MSVSGWNATASPLDPCANKRSSAIHEPEFGTKKATNPIAESRTPIARGVSARGGERGEVSCKLGRHTSRTAVPYIPRRGRTRPVAFHRDRHHRSAASCKTPLNMSTLPVSVNRKRVPQKSSSSSRCCCCYLWPPRKRLDWTLEQSLRCRTYTWESRRFWSQDHRKSNCVREVATRKQGPISIEELAIRVGAEAASMVQDVQGVHELATSGPDYEPDYETQRTGARRRTHLNGSTATVDGQSVTVEKQPKKDCPSRAGSGPGI
jgi:hypothetical protein